MPKKGTIEERSKFFHDQMIKLHSEIAWAVQVEIGANTELTCMWINKDAR
jgi:hypothetical protein